MHLYLEHYLYFDQAPSHRLFLRRKSFFFRFILAYVMLFLLSPRPILPRFDKQEALYAGAGLCGVTLYFLSQNIGLVYTTASNAGVIVCVAPMFTAIAARFFRYRRKNSQGVYRWLCNRDHRLCLDLL